MQNTLVEMSCNINHYSLIQLTLPKNVGFLSLSIYALLPPVSTAVTLPFSFWITCSFILHTGQQFYAHRKYIRFTAPFAFVPKNFTSTIAFVHLFIFTNMLELRNISPVRQICGIVFGHTNGNS
jgi:hypothetical protein